MARPTIVVVAAGEPGPAVRAAHGGFDRWFREALEPVADVRVVEPEGARAAATAPTFRRVPDGVDGVVLTGSYASVTERAPWMSAVGDALLEAAERVPVLGVCFGHQLLAGALGAAVTRNPRGPEVGTREVELTEAGRADPLLAGLPPRVAVQQLHEDHVPAPPPGAVLLATGAHTPVQAYAAGRIRCVQFHPEFSAARVRAMCDEERAWVERGGPHRYAEALATVRETPEANGLLRRWVERIVG